MTIVEYIAKTGGIEKEYKSAEEGGANNLDNFATAGFLWEHVMSRTERLEHALSREAVQMELVHNPNLLSPGEMFWCRQCDRFMTGGRHAQRHCRSKKHTGIYFTPDALDFMEQAYVEWKFTWRSSKRSHPDVLDSTNGVWRWPVQCMFNSLGLEVNKSKLVVLHCCGDYGVGLKEPEPFNILLEFTDNELERNKQMIVDNAIDLGWI